MCTNSGTKPQANYCIICIIYFFVSFIIQLYSVQRVSGCNYIKISDISIESKKLHL